VGTAIDSVEKLERRVWKWARVENKVAQFSRPKMAQFIKTVDRDS